MKDANFMTPAELRKLADKKEEEGKIVKEGFLKCDLYTFNSAYSGHPVAFFLDGDGFILTKDQVKFEINRFKRAFKKMLKKGTRFVCYCYDGEFLWFDDVNCGIEEMDECWAQKYLDGIKDL